MTLPQEATAAPLYSTPCISMLLGALQDTQLAANLEVMKVGWLKTFFWLRVLIRVLHVLYFGVYGLVLSGLLLHMKFS